MNAVNNLERVTQLSYWHVRGAMSASQEAAGLDWFHQISIDEASPDYSGFIACTGTTEFLVLDKTDSALIKKLQAQADDSQLHLFPRDDAVFMLHHPHWSKLLLEICSYDFSTAKKGQFITASMAGVGCWFVIKAPDAKQIMFGCDPSYEVYLQETILDVLNS